MRELTVTHSDREWHPAFCEFVHQQFPSISFERWTVYGGWDDGYCAFAFADGDRLVANASLARMDLVLHGKPVRGWQLGAVATDPAYQRQQLRRRIMQRLLEHPKDGDLIFLFANQTVLDFYPKFGFQRVRESLFGAPHRAQPEGRRLRKLSLESAEDRALLLQLAARAEPSTTLFGAGGDRRRRANRGHAARVRRASLSSRRSGELDPASRPRADRAAGVWLHAHARLAERRTAR